MNLEIILGLIVLVALLVSTGIITVGLSTFLNNIALKMFEKNGQPSPIGPDYTLKGDRSDELRQDLNDFPTTLKKWWLMSHIPTFFLILFVIKYSADGDFAITKWHFYIGNYPSYIRNPLGYLPSVSVFLLLGYIIFIVLSLLKYKSKLITIIGSRFTQ